MKWILGFSILAFWGVGAFLTVPISLTAKQALERGNYYFNVDGKGEYDLDRAQNYFEKALALDPSVPDAWHQLARIDFLRGNFDSALVKINKQLELHGNSLMASYYIRGLIEGYQKNYPAAQKDFQTFLSWDPHNWAANNDLAWMYFSQGRFAEAEAQTRYALQFDAANPWLLLSHGSALLNLGKREEARQEFLAAKVAATKLTPEQWDRAYPGNDPAVAAHGVSEMRSAIARNLALVEN